MDNFEEKHLLPKMFFVIVFICSFIKHDRVECSENVFPIVFFDIPIFSHFCLCSNYFSLNADSFSSPSDNYVSVVRIRDQTSRGSTNLNHIISYCKVFCIGTTKEALIIIRWQAGFLLGEEMRYRTLSDV